MRVAVQAEQHADDDHRDVGDGGHELAADEHRRGGPLRPHLRPVVPVDGAVEAGGGALADAVGPHRGGADDGLRHRGQHVADPLAHHAVDDGQPRGEEAHGDRQRHEAQQHDEGQLPGVDRHDDGGHEQLPEADHAQDAAPLHEGRQLVDVAGDAGDQRAAPLALLVQDRQVVDVPERPGAQPGQRGLGGAEQPDVHPVDRDAGDQDDDGADEHQGADQAEVGAAGGEQAAVDDLLDGDRHDDPARGGDQREGEGGRQPAAELGHGAQPAAQRRERALPLPIAHAATSACE